MTTIKDKITGIFGLVLFTSSICLLGGMIVRFFGIYILNEQSAVMLLITIVVSMIVLMILVNTGD